MKRSSFRQKLLRSFLLLAVVPLILCGGLLIGTFRLAQNSEAKTAAEDQLAALTNGMRSLFTDCRGAVTALARKPEVADALREEAERAGVYQVLYNTTKALRANADFSIYDSGGKLCFSTYRAMEDRSMDVDWGILRQAALESGVICRACDQSSAVRTGTYLQMALAVQEGGRVLGYVVADFSEAQLLALLGGQYSGFNGVVLLDPQWNTVACSQSLSALDIGGTVRGRMLRGESLAAPGEECNYYLSQDPDTGFFLLLRQAIPMTGETLRLLCTMAVLIVLAMLVPSVALALLYSRELFAPVRVLNDAMTAVEQGDLETQVSVDRTDEFGQLAEKFNHMVRRLQANVTEQIENQKRLNEAYIRTMQAQLKPHFLYNTLDTVKWMGKINHIPEISTIAADLADILRSSVSGEEFTPLREELQLLKRYTEIERIRFSGKFELLIQAEPETLDVPVPKLLLQPLVENAVIHGLRDCDSGRVEVRASMGAGTLEILVVDNGCGMPEEWLQKFRAGEMEQSGHLGLYNVDTILRLRYGAGHGLEFLETVDGTCVRIVLPDRREENGLC